MARDSIELTQYEPVSSRGKPRASSSQLRPDDSTQRSAISLQSNQERAQPRAAVPQNRRSQPRAAALQDDSELLINPEDLDLDDLDSEEAQFLPTQKRVPVRRSPIQKSGKPAQDCRRC